MKIRLIIAYLPVLLLFVVTSVLLFQEEHLHWLTVILIAMLGISAWIAGWATGWAARDK